MIVWGGGWDEMGVLKCCLLRLIGGMIYLRGWRIFSFGVSFGMKISVVRKRREYILDLMGRTKPLLSRAKI